MKWNIINILGILLLTTFCVNTVNADKEILKEWQAFKVKYDKQYSSKVLDTERFTIFTKNFNKIKEHNAKYAKGEVSYAMTINNFSDLSFKEFEKLYLMESVSPIPDNHIEIANSSEFSSKAIPASIDWRQRGAVTKVKNQGQCGSCWAFGANGALESQWFLKTGKLIRLSEQNLLDCTRSYGNNGCDGGSKSKAYSYIQKNNGVDLEEAYPYEGVERTCRFNNNKIGATISRYYQLPSGNENELKNTIATIGPITVSIWVQNTFNKYSHGVYDDSTCVSDRTNHAVTLVGYGTENGKDYWLVKNSWGSGWGDSGYIKMVRNKSNQCAIATYPVVPVV